MHFNSLSPYALFAFEYVRVNCTCRIYLACCSHVVKRNFRTQSVLLLPKILSRVWNVPYNPRPPIAGPVQYQPPPKAKHQGRQQLRSKWASKALHGKYPQRVKQADVDQDKTHRWLKVADLKAETEGFIIAAQDQSLATSWYQHNILKKPDVDPKCTLCGRFD